jgi:uncharacterized DUF497 family protein
VIFFDWDPHKERANRHKHRVAFSEAVGHSSAGRLLIVTFIDLLPEQVRIVSAPEATRREQRDYEEAV